MYHATDIKKWMGHVHISENRIISRVERLFLDKRFWAVVGIVVFVAAFTLLLIWASQAHVSETNTPFSPRPYFPLRP